MMTIFSKTIPLSHITQARVLL